MDKFKIKLLVWIISGIDKDGLRSKVFYFGLKRILNTQEAVKMFDKARQAVAGKKTYLTAAVTVLGAVLAWANGTMGEIDAIKLIVDAILAVTIRAGISKV